MNKISFIKTKCDNELLAIADEKNVTIDEQMKNDYRIKGCDLCFLIDNIYFYRTQFYET